MCVYCMLEGKDKKLCLCVLEGGIEDLWTITVRHWYFWELDYWEILLWSQTGTPSGYN